MRPTPIVTLLLAACIGFTSGCGTIVYGTRQAVDIQCSEPTAVITVDSRPIQPGQVKLKRANHHLVRVEAEGFKTTGAYIDNDLKVWVIIVDILLGGGVAVLVDAITGGWNALEPATVNLVLERDPDAAQARRVPRPELGYPSCECGFKVRPGTNCPNCGRVSDAAPTPPSTTPPSETKPTAGARFCGSCGARLSGGSSFCSSCGAKQ